MRAVLKKISDNLYRVDGEFQYYEDITPTIEVDGVKYKSTKIERKTLTNTYENFYNQDKHLWTEYTYKFPELWGKPVVKVETPIFFGQYSYGIDYFGHSSNQYVDFMIELGELGAFDFIPKSKHIFHNNLIQKGKLDRATLCSYSFEVDIALDAYGFNNYAYVSIPFQEFMKMDLSKVLTYKMSFPSDLVTLNKYQKSAPTEDMLEADKIKCLLEFIQYKQNIILKNKKHNYATR